LSPSFFQTNLFDDSSTGRFDARMKLPLDAPFEVDEWINTAFLNQSKSYFPDYVNYVYSGSSAYQPINHETIDNWTWPHRGSVGLYSPASIVDLQDTLSQNPSIKLLILHGYEDIATPGFQTELDLKGVDLSARVPVKWFEGGHMIYNSEVSRAPLKAELDRYYDDPLYSFVPPAAAVAATAAASN
jgi:carboxypeptidase C (cathepsin A)